MPNYISGNRSWLLRKLCRIYLKYLFGKIDSDASLFEEIYSFVKINEAKASINKFFFSIIVNSSISK